MKRRMFLKSLATVVAFAVLPKAQAHDPSIVFPSGTEIREVGTNSLIAVSKKDQRWGEVIDVDSFEWRWPRPNSGDAISPSIYEALKKAQKDYLSLALS